MEFMVNINLNLIFKRNEFIFQDGGSLDLLLKKVMRIPEHILGRITVAVSYEIEF